MLGMRPRLWLPCILQVCRRDGTFDTDNQPLDSSPSCSDLTVNGKLAKCLPCFPLQVILIGAFSQHNGRET